MRRAIAAITAGKCPFRSKPLNGYNFLPELYSAGVSAVKIEGRQKTNRYNIDSLRALRRAVDSLKEGRPLPRPPEKPGLFVLPPEATEGFFPGPALRDTIFREDGPAAFIRYLRTYLTSAGLPVAMRMGKLKREARRIESRSSDK